MATQAKVITRDGLHGLLMHKHGNSAWHPVNEKHTAMVGRADRDNDEGSHKLHKAEKPTWVGEVTEAQKNEYQEVLKTGVPQEFWHKAWLAKKAARKAKKAALQEAESILDIEAALSGEVVEELVAAGY